MSQKPKPMDRTQEHHFYVALFRCVAKYRTEWDDIEVEASPGQNVHCVIHCGPNLTLIQVQAYTAQKIIGELIRQLAIAKDYAKARWGKK